MASLDGQPIVLARFSIFRLPPTFGWNFEAWIFLARFGGFGAFGSRGESHSNVLRRLSGFCSY